MNRRNPPDPAEHVKASQQAGQLTPELLAWLGAFCRASSPHPLLPEDALQEMVIVTIRYLPTLKPDEFNMVGWFRTALHSLWALELRRRRREMNTTLREIETEVARFPPVDRPTLNRKVIATLQTERLI